MNAHTKGLVLTSLGVLLVSPDTLLIRLVDLDIWTVSVWRGSLQAAGLTFLIFCFFGRRSLEMFRAIGMVGLAIAVIFSCNTFAFLAAVRYTTVANTLIILSGTPFFAAVLSLIILKEPVARRTWVAIAATLFGIGVIVWDGLGSGGYFGDLMALLAAVLLAFKLTIVRQQRRINMIPALALSGLIFALMAIVIAGEPARPDTAQIIWLLLMGLAVITPATALLTLGPRYLSAPEVSLLMLLETVLGPVWVWLVIEETPTPLALTGGAIVVSTLMIHALAGLRKGRQSQSGDRGLVEGPVPAE